MSKADLNPFDAMAILLGHGDTLSEKAEQELLDIIESDHRVYREMRERVKQKLKQPSP